MPQEIDYEFGRVALRRGEVSQDEIEECIEVLVALERVGTRRRLWDLMERKGFMTAERIAAVRREAEAVEESSGGEGAAEVPDAAEVPAAAEARAEWETSRGLGQETEADLRAPEPRAVRHVLVHVMSSGKTEVYPLPMRPVSMGSSSACDIVISDGSVAERHARLTWNSRGCNIWDVGTASGVKVNHVPMRLKLLQSSDLVQLGSAYLLFLADYGEMGAPQPTTSGAVAGAPMARLRLTDGPSVGTSYFLGKRAVVIGRNALAPVRLDDEGISDFHAHVVYTSGGFRLTDLNSRTGVRVNGMRAREQIVRKDDNISVGRFTFSFSLFGAKSKEETKAPVAAEVPGEEGLEWDIAEDVEVEPATDPLMKVGIKAPVRVPPPPRPPKPYRPGELQLTCVEGTTEGRTFVVMQRRTVLGRSGGVDIVIDDPSLSRQHAEIVLEADQAVIRDLQSRNGIFVNGRRVKESPIRSGNAIRLGKVLLIAEEVRPVRRG